MSLKLRDRTPPGRFGRGSVLLGIVALLLIQRLTSIRLGSPRNFFRSLSAPIFIPFRMVANLGGSVSAHYQSRGDLEARIRQLETRAVELELAARLGEEARLEAERLREALAAQGAARDRLPLEPLFARVVGASSTPHERRLTLNRGREHGVRLDSPVIYGEDVLGRVVSVRKTTCRVLLIQDPVSALGILIEGLRTPGVAHGRGDALLTLSELPAQSKLSSGTRVLTGSLSSYYPKGLVVGVLESEAGEWRVRPRRDPLRLEEAFILPRGGR